MVQSYTLYDGSSYRSVRGLQKAIERGKWWSLDSGNVISVLDGHSAYMYIYNGEEISGLRANEVWMNESDYDEQDAYATQAQ